MQLKQARALLPRARNKLAFLPSAGGTNASHYKTAEHKAWRNAVLQRDRFTCKDCGAAGRSVRLVADHIKEIEDGGAPLDIANGRTRCQPCHNKKTAIARAIRNKA